MGNTLENRDSTPTLWNPEAAAAWSLLFTTAFGSYLHAQNAKSLGRDEEAKAHMNWFYMTLAFLVFVPISYWIPSVPAIALKLGGLALLAGWYFSLGKKQVLEVKLGWQGRYYRKSWKTPLLLGFGCYLFYRVFCVGLGLVLYSMPD